MIVRQLSRGTVAVFNPQPFSCIVDRLESWGSAKRTPFVLAVTEGDGSAFDNTRQRGLSASHDYCRSFPKLCYLLEDDLAESYCYPAVLEVKDGFLVAYYHSNGTGICLNSTKISKVYYDEVGL